jgi:hypothetical protein
LRAAVEGGEVGVIDDTEELDTALGSKPSKQIRILAFGRLEVVPAGADDAKLGTLVERLDQSVDALVRCQPSDEEDAAAEGLRGG